MTEPTKDLPYPILELHDLRMQFGGISALKGLNYAVPPGIIQAVIGPNGAGKTTLFHCISGIHQPTSGQTPNALWYSWAWPQPDDELTASLWAAGAYVLTFTPTLLLLRRRFRNNLFQHRQSNG